MAQTSSAVNVYLVSGHNSAVHNAAIISRLPEGWP